MKKLTIKKLSKLFKESEMIWQDQQNQNIFYFANSRDFYYKNKCNHISGVTKEARKEINKKPCYICNNDVIWKNKVRQGR